MYSSLPYWRSNHHHHHPHHPRDISLAGDDDDFIGEQHELKRRGSWSSDLVLCEGSSSVSDFDFAVPTNSSTSLLDTSRTSKNSLDDNKYVNTAIVSDGEDENEASYDYYEEKKDDDVDYDDDNFDFSHLLEDEEDDESNDHFEFEPYYDRQTNRTIMRLRMKNIKFPGMLDRQNSILEDEEITQSLVGLCHGEGVEVSFLDVEDDETAQRDPTSLQTYPQQSLPPSDFHRQQLHSSEGSGGRCDNGHILHHQQYQTSNDIDHSSLPLLCPSSVTSGSEETAHHPQHADNHQSSSKTSVEQEMHQDNRVEDMRTDRCSEPWRKLPPPPPPPPPHRPSRIRGEEAPWRQLPPPPPPPPPRPSRTGGEEALASSPNRSVRHQHRPPSIEDPNHDEDSSMLFGRQVRDTPRHLHSPDDDNGHNTQLSSMPSPATVSSSNEGSSSRPTRGEDAPEQDVADETLPAFPSVYADMIQNQQPIETVERLIRRDTSLTKREIDAFLLGVKCMQQRSASESLSSPSSSSSNNAPVTISNNKNDSNDETIAAAKNKDLSLNGDPKFKMSSRKLVMDILTDKANHKVRRSGREDDTKSAISAYTTMSCRELSIQRLQRRFAVKQQSRKDKEEDEKNNWKVENLLKELQDAQKIQKRLEKQLSNAGICLADDVPYEVAKQKVATIAQQMEAIGSSNVSHSDPKKERELRQRYYVLEQEMEKYMSALELTDEYLQEQLAIEQAWDIANHAQNRTALNHIWRNMPVNIRHSSVENWLATPTPNGSSLQKGVLVKFFRTNILFLLRQHPDYIRRVHPSNLEACRCSGLTVTERRALEAVLQPIATQYWQPHQSNPSTRRKWNWYCLLRQKLKDCIIQQQKHLDANGGSSSSCRCPHVGTSKCPLHESFDYSLQDCGYPCDLDNAVYEDPSGATAPNNNAKTVESPSSSIPIKKTSPASRGEPNVLKSKHQETSNNTKTLLSEIAAAKGKNSLRAKAAKHKQRSKSSSASSLKEQRTVSTALVAPRKSFLAELQARASQKSQS